MINNFLKSYKELLIEVLLVVLLTVIFLSLLFHKFFIDHFYYLSADIAEAYYPWWVFLNANLHQLHLPLLNRFWFSGSMPFTAIETSVFYPPYLLAQLFFNAQKSLNTAYFFHFGIELVHYLLASISFYMLSRVGLKLDRFASIFGGVIYACSGVFIGRFVHTVAILTISWLPSLYLFYLLFVRERKIIYALLASLVLVLIVVSGHPQMVYYTYLLFGLAILYFSFVYSQESRKYIFIISITIVFLSLLLSAFKLFLTVELIQNIVRTTNETTIKNLYNSLHPIYYLTLLVPYLFGKHFVGYWGSDYPWGNWENYIYIGIIPLIFLPFSFFWKNKKMLWFVYLNFALLFFFLLGKYNEFSAIVNQNMPFAESTTMISKLTNFFHFFLILIVTIGIHTALNFKKSSKYLIFIPTVVLLGLILYLVRPELVNFFHFTDRPLPDSNALKFISDNINQARYLFVLSTIAVSCFFLFKKEFFLYLMLLVYALDIFLSAGNFNPIEASPGPPNKYFGTNEIFERLKSDKEIFRVNNLWPRNVNMIQEVESTYGYHTIETKPYRAITSLLSYENKKIFDLMNVKYFIDDKDLGKYSNINQVMPNLWENLSVIPRIFFVPNFRLVTTKEEMVNGLVNPDFDPHREVLLYQSDYNGEISENYSREKGSVEITSYSATKVEAEVKLASSGFLIFSQFQYPGWYAVVDGKRVKLLRANLSFYALSINNGEHKVKFIYESKPLIYGLWIAGLTLILILFTFLSKRIRKYYFLLITKLDNKFY